MDSIKYSFIMLVLLVSVFAHAVFAGPTGDVLATSTKQINTTSVKDCGPLYNIVSSVPNIKILCDIPYGSDRKQRMDVYFADEAQTDAPVIFMVHGGAWRIGDKTARTVVANKVARWIPRGFIFVSVNYRLLPEADPLQQAEDVARALATAQALAPSWGGDPSKFILIGHSAGAHLVSLLAAAPSKAIAAGAQPWLGTIAIDTMALDVVTMMEAKHHQIYDRAFGSEPDYWQTVSPMQMLEPSTWPMLVICSSRRINSCDYAYGFAAQSTSLGRPTTVLEQDLSHRDINEFLGKPGAYTDAVEEFMMSLNITLSEVLSN